MLYVRKHSWDGHCGKKEQLSVDEGTVEWYYISKANTGQAADENEGSNEMATSGTFWLPVPQYSTSSSSRQEGRNEVVYWFMNPSQLLLWYDVRELSPYENQSLQKLLICSMRLVPVCWKLRLPYACFPNNSQKKEPTTILLRDDYRFRGWYSRHSSPHTVRWGSSNRIVPFSAFSALYFKE